MSNLIDSNGVIREMTDAELKRMAEGVEYLAPKPDPIAELKLENSELIKRIEKIEQDISDLQLESGGSVKPDIPYDPVPGTDKPFKPHPGGGLTIGG